MFGMRMAGLCQFYWRTCLFIFRFFCSRYLQHRLADLHQIFVEDGKWAATEKLSFRVLNSFGCGREAQTAIWRYSGFTHWEKKAVWFWPVIVFYQMPKAARKSVKGWPRSFGAFGVFLSASLYFSKRGADWDRLCRDVVGRWLVVTRVHCGQTVHPRPIVTMEH